MRGPLKAWLLAIFVLLLTTTCKAETNTSLLDEGLQVEINLRIDSERRLPQPPLGPLNFINVINRARQKAISGGLSGLIAGAVQVVTLMWLRTTVNYQYRYGVSMATAVRELYRQGGFQRFYRGLPYALVQGPLARFGGIAANDASIVFAAYLTGKSELLSKGMLSTALGSLLAGR